MVPAGSAPTEPDVLSGYQQRPGRYDECFEAAGRLRPHWADFFRRLGPDPAGAIRRAEAACRRMIIEQDVSMNVYAGERSGAQPWPLDPLPFLISAGDWRVIEAGLRQRAELFNRLLQDLYGPQNLLRTGRLPAGLAMANPRFLRTCAGLGGPRARLLHSYAADLARSPDGRWWVLEDRLDAPSGLGYSLQTRIIVRQALPGVFGRAPVHRLYRFFRDFRSALERAGPDPLVVFLTPGPANETYFEHAYLARYLGYPLVEGADLTTRDEQVFLRTVGGLRRVDAIVRRIDSEFCDPLELNEDSVLGVPGLTHAALAGRVHLANQLGCGALESPGLMAFLAPLCRQLLGEELRLPSAGTWWCGQAPARDYVLANLDNLVIKPAFRGPGAPPTRYGAVLEPAERAALAADLRARPEAYCGQERVMLGTAPGWVDQAIRPVPVTVRVFLAWCGEDYRVMPGGFTRFNPDGEDAIVSMQQGGVAKDTWVLAEKPVEESPGRSAPEPPPLRGPTAIPSRLADNLYWLGRYLDRAAQLARMLAKLDPLANDVAVLDPGVAAEMARLLGVLQGGAPERASAFAEAAAAARAAARDRTHATSLAATLAQMLRIVDQLKARLPPEAGRIVRGLRATLESGDPTDAAGLSDQLSVLETVSAESLPHDTGWRFLDLGRRVERGQQLVFLLRGLLVGTPRPVLSEFRLQTLLYFAESLFMYRSVRPGGFPSADVLDWLISAEENPRGLRFQAARIAEHLEALPADLEPGAVAALRRNAFRLLSTVRLADAPALARSAGLAEDLLAEVGRLLVGLSDQITEVYFTHAEASARS